MEMGVRLAYALTRPSKPKSTCVQRATHAGTGGRCRFWLRRPDQGDAPNHSANPRAICARARYFFFFGESTMIIWRPSIFGICSTWPTSSRSVRRRSSIRMPISW